MHKAPWHSKLPPSTWHALLAHATYLPIFFGANLFIATFLISVTHDFATVGVFRAISFTTSALTFLMIARWCKRGYYLPLYRVGFLITALVFIACAVLGARSGNHVAELALLFGFGAGLYWLPYNLYKMALSARAVRFIYFSYEQAILQCVRIIFPTALGSLIWYSGSYMPFFIFSIVVLALGFYASKRLKRAAPKSSEPFMFAQFLRRVVHEPQLQRSYLSAMMMGIGVWGTLDIIVPLLIFTDTGSEQSLGLYASLFPIASLLTIRLLGNVGERHKELFLAMSAVGIVLSAVVLVTNISLVTLVINGCMATAGATVLSIFHSERSHSVIDHTEDLARYTVEHFVTLEIALLTGRLIGLSTFFYLSGYHPNPVALKCVIIALSLSTLGTVYFLHAMKRCESAATTAQTHPATSPS